MNKHDVLSFIQNHQLMLLATTHVDGRPEAAVVEFAETEDLGVIFDTLKTSRKYANLKRDPRIAVVIGWDEAKTVQLEGVVEELAGDSLARAQEIYFAKNPRAKKWADNPDIVYMEIKPTWIRYTDLNQHPWLIQEIDLRG